MIITKEIEIDMGHRVPNHKSKCSSLHGHRYKIEVGVDDKLITTPGASDEGMVMDFGDLKQVMLDTIDYQFDHGCILYKEDPLADAIVKDKRTTCWLVDFIPTAENLAKFWFDKLSEALKEKEIKMKHIKLWETPTSTAYYTGEE